MQTIHHRDHTIIVIEDGDDVSDLHILQDNIGLSGHDKNKIIYVALEGTEDKYLHPDRFLVKNREASLSNHFMWEGMTTPQEHDEYLMILIDKFIDTGKQIIIEDYVFADDEPFYDYGGGRD
jgi:hypothetical protein